MKGGIKFNTDDVIMCASVAGGGKTTYLMGEINEMLKTVRPDEIAFSTFTRKGVYTGIERVLQNHPRLRLEDFPYFQTLHRMCFHEAGFKRVDIISLKDIAHFNKLFGYNVTFGANAFNMTGDDKLIRRYNAIRSGVPLSRYTHELIDEERYASLTSNYIRFKQKNNLVDYHDCLIGYLKRGSPLPVEVYILDESQDASALQWQVVELAAYNAKKIRIAGDWAQTIFDFNGSDIETALLLMDVYPVKELDTTYRLPRKICRVADAIERVMTVKRPRTHVSAKDEEGIVDEIADLEVLCAKIRKTFTETNGKPGSWYCLFRANHHFNYIIDGLERNLIPYHTPEGFMFPERELAKIVRYYNYKKWGYGSEDAKLNFMEKYGITNLDHPFSESSLISGERRYVMQDYVDAYGIKALEKMASSEPFLLLSTTYKVKGGEADNVAVFLDASKRILSNMLFNLDSELRVFYVACTRARHALYIVSPLKKDNLGKVWESVRDNIVGGL